jgi:hypothetical protein
MHAVVSRQFSSSQERNSVTPEIYVSRITYKCIHYSCTKDCPVSHRTNLPCANAAAIQLTDYQLFLDLESYTGYLLNNFITSFYYFKPTVEISGRNADGRSVHRYLLHD